MADKKSKIKSLDSDPGASAEPEISLGKIVTEARERKGLTREQVVLEAHLPAHYVKMIETDSYGLISDQLYLVPFLRRYAAFLGLDAEDVASRFVRDVQHAEANVVRISQEITMVTSGRRGGVGRRFALYALIVVVLILLADFAYRRFFDHHAEVAAPVASPAAIAPGTLPPATIDNNPERGESRPPAIPPASTIPPIAPKGSRIQPAPRPIPAPATD